MKFEDPAVAAAYKEVVLAYKAVKKISPSDGPDYEKAIDAWADAQQKFNQAQTAETLRLQAERRKKGLK
jgi:hypothetical protein